MLALVKTTPDRASSCATYLAGHRDQRRPHPGPEDRDLRHGPPHRVVGSVGRRDDQRRRSSSATSSSARSSRSARTSATSIPATSSAARATSSAVAAATASPASRHLCANTIGLGVGRDGAFAEYVALPMTNVWHHWPGIDEEVAAIFDPFGNAVHTALSFPVLGEDVLVSGAGPIGLMAIAVVKHAGARFVVVSEPNAYRRELALRMGATIAVDPTRARPRRGPARSSGWSRASTSRSRCPATPTALRVGHREHGPRRRRRDPRHPDRGDLARRQPRSSSRCSRCAASTAARCTRPGTR